MIIYLVFIFMAGFTAGAFCTYFAFKAAQQQAIRKARKAQRIAESKFRDWTEDEFFNMLTKD